MTLPPDISARVSRRGPIAIAAQTWRNPAQLRDWLDDTFADPSIPDNVKREKAGIFKELVEEVLPLTLFAEALSGQAGLSDADLAFKPVIGSQPYDALVRIRQPENTEEFQIEIVTATRDGEQDSLMLKAISDHGQGSPDTTYRRGRGESRIEISSDGVARSAASLKSELLTAMCAAFDKKNARAHRYTARTWLLISITDGAFTNRDDVMQCAARLTEHVATSHSGFSRVVVIGSRHGLVADTAPA